MSALLELAGRVEHFDVNCDPLILWAFEREVHAAFGRTLVFGDREVPPSYLKSWDVAIGTILPDWQWTINNYDGRTTDYHGAPDVSRPYRCCMGSIIECDAATGPAAITAAALRSRAGASA